MGAVKAKENAAVRGQEAVGDLGSMAPASRGRLFVNLNNSEKYNICFNGCWPMIKIVVYMLIVSNYLEVRFTYLPN